MAILFGFVFVLRYIMQKYRKRIFIFVIVKYEYYFGEMESTKIGYIYKYF
jgi:hypothetical protein